MSVEFFVWDEAASLDPYKGDFFSRMEQLADGPLEENIPTIDSFIRKLLEECPVEDSEGKFRPDLWGSDAFMHRPMGNCVSLTAVISGYIVLAPCIYRLARTANLYVYDELANEVHSARGDVITPAVP